MIKVVEFKDIIEYETMYANTIARTEYEKCLTIQREKTNYAINQLNEYLKEHEEEIELIEIQKHSDCYVLIYLVIDDNNRGLIRRKTPSFNY